MVYISTMTFTVGHFETMNECNPRTIEALEEG